ncbi:ribokinase [Rhodobacterales bacterium HKCCE3408]|nr:ribokinase [Rhodobacterales bacterium HKCCE3408]
MILNVGSINIDLVYRVPHLVRPGETLAATEFSRGLGGKGANQSVAAARAGAQVRHCGAIGADGADMVAGMEAAGVDCGLVARLDMPTGHAIVMVDGAGENAIVLAPSANQALPEAEAIRAVGTLGADDWLILQNEVNVSALAAKAARKAGARVVYSAAPFDAGAVAEVMADITHLLVNEGENAALEEAGIDLPVGLIRVVTKGSDGATWIGPEGEVSHPAFPVSKVVDTTGAGDCFAGNLVAALDRGAGPEAAMRFAQAAAAIQITRPGAAPAMPGRTETEAFLAAR